MADYLITVLLRFLSRLLRVCTNLDDKPSMNNVLLLVKGGGGVMNIKKMIDQDI